MGCGASKGNNNALDVPIKFDEKSNNVIQSSSETSVTGSKTKLPTISVENRSRESFQVCFCLGLI